MSDSANKRIAKNTAFLYLRMLFVLVVSLYTSRVVLNVLGVEDYGIYNVVFSFVSLFGFLNSTLSASMQRFFNYEIGKSNPGGVTLIYTMGFWTHLAFCTLLCILLETFGVWYINNIMVIPAGRLMATNMVYQSAVISMLLVIMQIPYIGAILAYERMDYYAYISILDTVLKLIIVIILPHLSYDKLILYAILYSLISVFDFLAYLIYVKKHFDTIHLVRVFKKDRFKEMLSFSGWNLIGTFAFVLKGQGLNLLLNAFFGPAVNAARGISYQVSSALSNFTHNITTSFRPQVVESYARDELERVKFLFYTESRICTSLILILIVPVVMEIEFILRIWLGETIPENTAIFTLIVLFDLLICTINPIIVQVAFANGNIKRFQVANSIVNLTIIPVAWTLLYFGASAISVFILSVFFSIINQVVCLTELNKIIEIDIQKYMKKVILPCITTVFLSFIPQILLHEIMEESWLRFILTCLLDITVTTLLICFISFSKVERSYIKNLIVKLTSKSRFSKKRI